MSEMFNILFSIFKRKWKEKFIEFNKMKIEKKIVVQHHPIAMILIETFRESAFVSTGILYSFEILIIFFLLFIDTKKVDLFLYIRFIYFTIKKLIIHLSIGEYYIV